jgi:hypothetical protein
MDGKALINHEGKSKHNLSNYKPPLIKMIYLKRLPVKGGDKKCADSSLVY